MGNAVKGFREVKRQNYKNVSRAIIGDVIFSLQREDVAVKVLKPDATLQSSNDFVKEVQNMVELASKQKCLFIIELRGVSKGIFLLLLIPMCKILMATTGKSTNIEQLYLRSRKDARCIDWEQSLSTQPSQGSVGLERALAQPSWGTARSLRNVESGQQLVFNSGTSPIERVLFPRV